jgi:anthranilate synthase component 1
LSVAPHNAEAAQAALTEGRNTLVWRRVVADTETPIGAALKLIEPGRGDYLLESVEGGEIRGRYSMLGLDPDLLFRATGASAEVNRRWRLDRSAFTPLPGNSLEELRALAGSCRIAMPEGLPPALAFLVGYFGYETIGLVETLPRAPQSELALPDMLFARPALVLVFDRLTDGLYIVAPLWTDAAGSPEDKIARAGERIDEALRRLGEKVPDSPRLADQPELALEAVMDPAAYAEIVLRAKDYISAGDIFQVVLAQRFTCPFPLPPVALYRALRRVNPSPFLYFLDLPGFAVVGSSPEILVRVRNNEVTIRPIAGTRPRGATESEDKANELSLLTDPKECAEHLMLLDLGRNDVGRVAGPDSVTVTDSFTIERYSHVMHIVSNVVGRLAEGKDALDALFAGFPAGTVSGAPKIRACEIIAELEPETRGPYAGGVGYFAPDGSVDSCIVLRTAVVKDGVMHVQAGAGIVADSNPEYEAAECRHKAGALIAAAREAVAVASEAQFGQ